VGDFLSFDISDPSKLTYLDSITVGGVNNIFVSNTAAYVASPNDDAELRVVDVTNPAFLQFVPGSHNGAPEGGFNISDTTRDGLSISLTGDAAVLRQIDNP